MKRKSLPESVRELANSMEQLFMSQNEDSQKEGKNPQEAIKLIHGFLNDNAESLAKQALSHEKAIKRILARGLEVNTVIDVGASNGGWSKKILPYLPKTNFLLIEGYEHWRDELNEVKKHYPQMDFALAAAGAECGTTYFYKAPEHPTGGHAFHEKLGERYEEVPQTTIDHEVEKRKLKGPFFVKLDTHGCEKEILRGAAKTLKETNLLLVETYNFDPGPERPRMRFHEMCAFLEELGFRCVDLGEPLFREYDKSFWQMDLFFLPATRKEFQVSRYK